MSKHQQIFTQMLDQNQQLFRDFQLAHDQFLIDPQTAKPQFDLLGKQALSVIQYYDRRLCSSTERGGYSQYSANLSEKFWSLVRSRFPKIDLVGTK